VPAPTRRRGFTLIELAVVVAIIGILAAVAWSSLSKARPRATLAAASNELQAIIHAGRQQALASGHSVVVLVFPAFAAPGGRIGRVVIVEDQAGTFFDAASALNLASYNPATPATPAPLTQTPTIFDLPVPITFVAPAGSVTIPPPFNTVSIATMCTFCDPATARGAIRFDERGRAAFFSGNGLPLAVGTGASLTLGGGPDIAGSRTLVITSGSGAVLTFNNG
jgi:prepilin-type N-terminal cleavage/methylation domain-containing protein